jgi:integrase/recombinase XerD
LHRDPTVLHKLGRTERQEQRCQTAHPEENLRHRSHYPYTFIGHPRHRDPTKQSTETYIDFFTSTIRNRNTRQAYARACWQFFDWCAAHGPELTTVRPFHVAAWIEDFPGSKPTIKQKLAAVRMLYDFLVVRQITPSNPAHSVRGPKYVVKKGKTPVWSREDAKKLLDSISKESVSGLRDLALIAAMFYSFARVSAVLKELVSYCAS